MKSVLAEEFPQAVTCCGCSLLCRRGSRGGEMSEFSPPPLLFWAPFFLFFFSYPSTRLWFYYTITKIHPHFKILDPRLLCSTNVFLSSQILIWSQIRSLGPGWNPQWATVQMKAIVQWFHELLLSCCTRRVKLNCVNETLVWSHTRAIQSGAFVCCI